MKLAIRSSLIQRLDEVQDTLKKLAIKDAKSEAKELASAFDAKLDRVYSVNFAHAPSMPTPYAKTVND